MEPTQFEENVLLYFYSTVPQVLGAMLALLGVLHILRIDRFTKQILSISQKIIDKCLDPISESQSLYARIRMRITGYKKLNDIIKELESIQKEENIFLIKPYFDKIIKKLDKNIQEPEPVREMEKENKKFLTGECNRGQKIIREFESIKKLTGDLFWINGLIVLFYLASFIFLPKYIQTQYSYWISLIVGVLIAAFSLYTMVGYIYNAVSENNQTCLLNPFWKTKDAEVENKEMKEKSK